MEASDNYSIRITAPAEIDIANAFEYIQQTSSLGDAQNWLAGLFDAIFSLQEFPHRCPIIPESELLRGTIRHLLYVQYRIIFDTYQTQEGNNIVRILRIRHGAQKKLQSNDVNVESSNEE